MEMHQVRYFLALEETLNFTRAAERCNISQPSLTRAIKGLEAEFGGLLFHRERANTRLTELGRMIAPHLRQVWSESAAAKQIARDLAQLNKIRLRLGVMCTIAPGQLVRLIGAVAAQHPNVELELTDANGPMLHEKLLMGDIEVALYCLMGVEPDERVHILPLFTEQMVIALKAGHPLAERAAIAIPDLGDTPYIQRINCEFDGYADPFFDVEGVTGEVMYRCERDDWAQAMVAEGLGYAFMPRHTVTHPGVVGRPTLEPDFRRTVNLVTVRGRPHSPALGALVREAMAIEWFGEQAVAARLAAEQDDDPPLS